MAKHEKPRLVDIVILFCPHCDKRIAAVGRKHYSLMKACGIEVRCEPCHRRIEELEHEKGVQDGGTDEKDEVSDIVMQNSLLHRHIETMRIALALVDQCHRNQSNWVEVPSGQRARFITAEERIAVVRALDIAP